MNKLSKSNIKRVRMLLRSYKARFGAFIDPNTGIVFFDPKDPRDRNDNRAWARAIHACRYFFNDDECDVLLNVSERNHGKLLRNYKPRTPEKRHAIAATRDYMERRREALNPMLAI